MRRIKKCANFGGIFTSTIAPVINGVGGVLDDTLSKQGINQVKIEDPNTETDNNVIMRCGGKARPKCWLGAAIGATTSLASGLIGGAASRKAARKAAALRNRQTMIQDMQGIDKQLNALYSTYLNNNDNEEDLIYRRGGTATQHPRRRELTDAQYYSIMKRVAIDNWRKWGDASPAAAFNRAINSNAYDYRGYYNKYPNSRANADTHWTDEFKGVGEKTFSDQSKYSGVKHPKYNPNGIRGGHWYGANEDMFVPSIQQLVERSKFAKGGKYNFTNFANRLERNVNESDNTRVASGRRVINSRNRQYRRDNSLIGKVINYIDKTDRHAKIISKGTLTAQQYRNSKAAQTFGQYERVNYNGKTYYVPQIQGGIAPTVGISNAGKVASFYNRLDKAKRVFSGAPSVNNLRRQPNLPSLETIISGGRNNFKGISNTERSFRPNPVMPKGYKVTGLKGTQSPKEIGKSLYNYLTRRTAIVPDRGNVKPFGTNSNSTYNAIRPKLYNTRISPVYRTDNNPAYIGRIPFMSVGDRIRVGEDIIKNTKAYKTLYRLSKSEDFPKVVGYTALGVPLALGSAYGAYTLLNNTNNSKSNNINNKKGFKKPDNNPKAKAQPQQVKNNTAQVANQTPNDSTIVQNNTQNDTTKVVNNQVPVANNRTTNQAVNSTQTSTNNQRAATNKNKTKSAAQTIQRKGRTKSRVSANRINNISNNFRQNINFEPIDDTVNGYSQVEDIQGRSYDEYQADIDAEAEARRQEVINDLLTNYNYEDRNTTDEMRYGGKARSKRRVPIKITDGGIAQRIGNNTFLLRGSSHEQVNPSGQTGIGIKVGNNEIEAEGGEVAQRVGNALRIFSAQPMINGVSPAQAVEAGANKNRIFAIQEALKRKGYKCGGRVKLKCGGRVKLKPGGKVNPIFKYNNYDGIEDLPNSNTGISSETYNNGNLSLAQAEKTIFPKGFVSHNSNNIGSSKTDTAPIDNWWNRNGMSVNSSDWIGLGTDLAGSLALGAFNTNTYKNLKYDYKLPNYVDEIPVAFDTTYHNDAQRATVERNRLNAQKIIANNTSSANAAVQRMQQSNADAMMETNKLWDEKANKEAELRNMAAQNEQQVRARNAAARNQYYQNVAEIQNKRIDAENANRLARSNAWVTSLQGLQGAANNFLNSTRQRYEDENALMATIAAGDVATPYRMMAFGTQFGPRVINAIRAMNNVEGMKDPGAAPVRSNYSNDADYSNARSKWETAMKNYEYWKQRNQFLSNYDSRGRLIRRR